MKINGLSASDYRQQEGKVTIQFTESTFDDLMTLDTTVLTVTTDTGDQVEVINGFSVIEKVALDLASGVFTLVAAKPTEVEQLVGDVEKWAANKFGLHDTALTNLENENTVLRNQLEATQAALDYLLLNTI